MAPRVCNLYSVEPMLKILAFLGTTALTATALAGDALAADADHGRYLATIMDCGGCHSGMTPQGAPDPAQYLTGATVGFEMPGLGIFWPPNLTPSPEGLGAWSDEQVVAAIRTGMRPDGRQLAPIMPYGSYGALTDADVADLVAFLRTLPPSANKVPDPVAPGGKAVAPYLKFTPPE